MPTQCEPKDNFLGGIGLLSGLDAGKTQAITDRLAWGNSIRKYPTYCFSRSLSGRPLSRGAAHHRIVEVQPEYAQIDGQDGGPTKLVADNLIGRREVPAAERLGVFLTTRKRARWRYKAGKDISGGGQEGEIDLLAWTPNSPDELLLIEYKAALEAAEIHEVNEVTAQTQEGQQQLRRCVDILTALTPRQKHAIYPFVPWETIRSIYGIVITSGGTISCRSIAACFPPSHARLSHTIYGRTIS